MTLSEDCKVEVDCFDSLHASFQKLEHLRLLQVFSNNKRDIVDQLSSFKTLKILSLDYRPLAHFRESRLPPNLEIIHLIYYEPVSEIESDSPDAEEYLIYHLLRIRPSKRLREVIVPSALIGIDGTKNPDKSKFLEDVTPRVVLQYQMKKLNEKLKLRLLDVGEIGELQGG